jgi:Spy/CpxP family protein refolding chaperone
MKTKNLFIIALLVLSLTSIKSFGQRGAGNRGACNLPDLTQDQQEKILSLQTVQLNASNQHRAKMDELRARKQSLGIANNPNMSEMNSVIDEMEKLRSEHFKANAAHRQSIREILTPEQRAIFDSRHANIGSRMGKQAPRRDGNGPHRRGRN